MSEPDLKPEHDPFVESLENVETAFAWADTHASAGDFKYALKWLDVGLRLSDKPAADLSAKRKRWARALEQRQRMT